MKKLIALFAVVAAFLSIAVLGALIESDTENVTALTLLPASEKITVECGKSSPKSYFTVSSAEDFSADDIEFVSDNTDVAAVHYDTISPNTVYYTVEGISTGETYIYFTVKDGDIISEKIKIIVTAAETEPPVTETCASMATETAESETEASETTLQSTEPPAAEPPAAEPPVTEAAKAESSVQYAEQALNKEQIQSHSENDEATVYITPTGKKYHYSKSCAGKNAIPTTLGKARQSYDPCKKCA